MISFDDFKNKIEEIGYFAEEELLYDAYDALLMFSSKKKDPGQDIFAICLEGPPGAGKTEFAKVYTKLANEIFENVELVDYQCDATTGKEELFEDINISAAIKSDAEHVVISGKLIEAIKRVNEGKKIVLFIDEYDKAREETDAFFLQLLQDGKVNSNQHGDLEIKEEYKNNLQVILCKNDLREELSGPLSRRIRIIRLDYMQPHIFYRVATKVLVEENPEPVESGLINLVSLIYEKAYNNKELFKRLPSCSEMLLAILDANRLTNYANAPQSIIYKKIMKGMFKSIDDLETFKSVLETSKEEDNSNLKEIISYLENPLNSEQSINSLIAKSVFKDSNQELFRTIEKLEKLISIYENKTKSSVVETTEQASSNEIQINSGKFISTEHENVPRLFRDESANIKRGYNIFGLSNRDWTEVASIKVPSNMVNELHSNICKYASGLYVTVYENGYLLNEHDPYVQLSKDKNTQTEHQVIIAVQNISRNGEVEYKILSNYPIISLYHLKDIINFTKFVFDVNEKINTNIILSISLLVDTLIFNRQPINNQTLSLKKIDENIYHYRRELNPTIKDSIDIEFENIFKQVDIKHEDETVWASLKLLNEKRKELK